MTAVATNGTEPTVQAEVVSIPLSLIDRDPRQPRFAENVDTDLAPSFKAHGWFESEPLEIRPHPEDPDRYMLVDGERRYAGAKAAGLKEALCILTFEADGVSEADRLMRQIMHNSGKPLTPVEQALAFKRIIEDRRADKLDENGNVEEKGDPKYGAVALARELGIAKSTVTDRLAITEIPEFWLKLIVEGPLQPSHVPALHRWRKLPEKYQQRGLEKMKNDWKWPGTQRFGSRGAVKGDRLYIGDFENMLTDAMRSYVKPVSEVPGYKGPTERMLDTRGYPRTTKTFAMDPAIWQPIARKKSAERAKKRKAAGGGVSDWAKQQAEQNRRYELQRQREEREAKRFKAARPALLEAFAAKLAGASHAELRSYIMERLRDYFREAPKHIVQAAAQANTPDAFMRAVAMLMVASTLGSNWNGPRDAPKLGKRWKVDVAKLVKAGEDDEQPDPATTDPGESGDGLEVVGAGPEGDDESDES